MPVSRLFSTITVEEQWRSVTGLWLREQAGSAWKNPKPTVVLTPSRAENFYLRSRLVEEKVPFLGLRFWTPTDARQFLSGELSPEIAAASPAELRLLARICAEDLLGRENVPDRATLATVLKEPGPFLRAYDLLLGAGWEPAQVGAGYGRTVATEMQSALKKHKIATQAGLHRHLRRLAAAQNDLLIANLLVIGFNAEHWPLWDLLQTTLACAEKTVIGLLAPRGFGEEVDQLWIGSWEQATGVATEIPPDAIAAEEPPFAGLVASYEQGVLGGTLESDLTFLVTPDLTSQARAVVLQAIGYLKCDSCTRLGIVFAESNALALEIAAELRRLGVPLDDGTGSILPGIFERRCWQSWIALQEEPSVQLLVAWLRAGEAQGVSCGLDPLSAREAADALESALAESLVDDLTFLAGYLEENPGKRHAVPIAAFLRKRVALPEAASFSTFLSATRDALVTLGWAQHLAQLPAQPPAWLQGSDRTISRRIFLNWLREATDSRERKRGVDGNHFYGKVHLLIYSQVTGQTWSHLILTGLNEGVWPRVFEAEAFGSRHELAALNQQARMLNRLSLEQGGQGEGHDAVREGHAWCLVPLERRDLALRNLCLALEGTSVAVCLAAMTTEAGRSLLPSDFFNHAYLAQTGRILDEDTFRSLANSTFAWCRRHQPLLLTSAGGTTPSNALAATRMAYDARRDGAQPFGPYEFAYRQPPARPIQLSCKTWEDAWNHPSQVWLEKVVGVSPWPEGMLSWSRAVGTWVHRWLMSALRECRDRNSTANFPSLLRDSADRDYTRVRHQARAAGLELYPWWDQVWVQARAMALGLGESLIPHLPDKRFLSEYRLPDHVIVALPGSDQADFALTGRIDLLLLEPEKPSGDPANGDFSGCNNCWVIDFKTGSASSLTLGKVASGTGLQAVLYALALRARGAGLTAISLQTLHAPLKRQVQLDDVLAMTALFRSLDKLHRSGVFGMRADAENAYGFSPDYPMATTSVPPEILEAKWALVHGTGLALEEEDE